MLPVEGSPLPGKAWATMNATLLLVLAASGLVLVIVGLVLVWRRRIP